MGYIPINPNPNRNQTGDCVIRAICVAEDRDWDDVFLDIMTTCFVEKLMIEDNRLWNLYLHKLGYKRHIIPDTCPDCYTVREFAEDHPEGTYILGTGTHAIGVVSGNYYDSWDSGSRVPIFYWKKEV